MMVDCPIWKLVDRLGKEIILECGMIVIGSGACDIVLESSSINEEHCVLAYDEAAWCYKIKDLTSANGTFVNETQIPSNTYIFLRHNDTIRFGYHSSVYRIVTDRPTHSEMGDDRLSKDCMNSEELLFESEDIHLYPKHDIDQLDSTADISGRLDVCKACQLEHCDNMADNCLAASFESDGPEFLPLPLHTCGLEDDAPTSALIGSISTDLQFESEENLEESDCVAPDFSFQDIEQSSPVQFSNGSLTPTEKTSNSESGGVLIEEKNEVEYAPPVYQQHPTDYAPKNFKRAEAFVINLDEPLLTDSLEVSRSESDQNTTAEFSIDTFLEKQEGDLAIRKTVSPTPNTPNMEGGEDEPHLKRRMSDTEQGNDIETSNETSSHTIITATPKRASEAFTVCFDDFEDEPAGAANSPDKPKGLSSFVPSKIRRSFDQRQKQKMEKIQEKKKQTEKISQNLDIIPDTNPVPVKSSRGGGLAVKDSRKGVISKPDPKVVSNTKAEKTTPRSTVTNSSAVSTSRKSDTSSISSSSKIKSSTTVRTNADKSDKSSVGAPKSSFKRAVPVTKSKTGIGKSVKSPSVASSEADRSSVKSGEGKVGRVSTASSRPGTKVTKSSSDVTAKQSLTATRTNKSTAATISSHSKPQYSLASPRVSKSTAKSDSSNSSKIKNSKPSSTTSTSNNAKTKSQPPPHVTAKAVMNSIQMYADTKSYLFDRMFENSSPEEIREDAELDDVVVPLGQELAEEVVTSNERGDSDSPSKEEPLLTSSADVDAQSEAGTYVIDDSRECREARDELDQMVSVANLEVDDDDTSMKVEPGENTPRNHEAVSFTGSTPRMTPPQDFEAEMLSKVQQLANAENWDDAALEELWHQQEEFEMKNNSNNPKWMAGEQLNNSKETKGNQSGDVSPQFTEGCLRRSKDRSSHDFNNHKDGSNMSPNKSNSSSPNHITYAAHRSSSDARRARYSTSGASPPPAYSEPATPGRTPSIHSNMSFGGGNTFNNNNTTPTTRVMNKKTPTDSYLPESLPQHQDSLNQDAMLYRNRYSQYSATHLPSYNYPHTPQQENPTLPPGYATYHFQHSHPPLHQSGSQLNQNLYTSPYSQNNGGGISYHPPRVSKPTYSVASLDTALLLYDTETVLNDMEKRMLTQQANGFVSVDRIPYADDYSSEDEQTPHEIGGSAMNQPPGVSPQTDFHHSQMPSSRQSGVAAGQLRNSTGSNFNKSQVYSFLNSSRHQHLSGNPSPGTVPRGAASSIQKRGSVPGAYQGGGGGVDPNMNYPDNRATLDQTSSLKLKGNRALALRRNNVAVSMAQQQPAVVGPSPRATINLGTKVMLKGRGDPQALLSTSVAQQNMNRFDYGRHSLKIQQVSPNSGPMLPQPPPQPQQQMKSRVNTRNSPAGSKPEQSWQSRRKEYDPMKPLPEGKLNSIPASNANSRRGENFTSSLEDMASELERLDTSSRADQIAKISSELSRDLDTLAKKEDLLSLQHGNTNNGRISAFSPLYSSPDSPTLSNYGRSHSAIVLNDNKISSESYDTLLVSSIHHLSSKLRKCTDDILQKIRRSNQLSRSPSPINHLFANQDSTVKSSNQELAEALTNMKAVEYQLQTMNHMLFPQSKSGRSSALGSCSEGDYLQELERINQEIRGFVPIEKSVEERSNWVGNRATTTSNLANISTTVNSSGQNFFHH